MNDFDSLLEKCLARNGERIPKALCASAARAIGSVKVVIDYRTDYYAIYFDYFHGKIGKHSYIGSLISVDGRKTYRWSAALSISGRSDKEMLYNTLIATEPEFENWLLWNQI